MNGYNAAVLFVVAWWMAFFITLPFGVKVPDEPEPGHAPSAPENPRLLIKAAIATLAAAVLTGFVAAAVEYDWIDFRGMVEQP